MDRTIRNLDSDLYRAMKAQAALRGQALGELMNEALRAFLTQRVTVEKTASVLDMVPKDFPPGNENLSLEIDALLYGAESNR